MTNPEVRRQKQLARQRQKLKDKTKRAAADKAAAVQKRTALNGTAPILDCLVPDDLFQEGLGTLVLSRALPDGRVAVAMFLVDIGCLGVKNALHATLERDSYEQKVAPMRPSAVADVTPEFFRKLVEGAVAYALDLGFPPHRDYAVARQIFGNLDAAACPQEFVYGRNGAPFHVPGPGETMSQTRAIMAQLERRLREKQALQADAPPPAWPAG